MRSALPYPPPFQSLATLAEHISFGESTIENWAELDLFLKSRKNGGLNLRSSGDVERHLAGLGDIAIALDRR